jgi:hypothetical protein
VTRFFPLALVLALLAATTVAFVVTEGLKLEPSPIRATQVTKTFAPGCDCKTHDARIAFTLRRRDTITVAILDQDKRVVRTLLADGPVQAGKQVFHWDGTDESGLIVPEAAYEPRVELHGERRTITLPNPIVVDTTPPTLRVLSVKPRTFSPDDDGHSDRLSIRYRQSERGHPFLLVDGVVRVRALAGKTTGKLDWYGKVSHRSVPSGNYRITVLTRDIAGNLSRPVTTTVRVRYIAVTPRVVRARAGAMIRLHVSTDARRFHWRLGKRTGTAAAPTLALRAPQKPGRYRLVVRERTFTATALLIIRA